MTLRRSLSLALALALGAASAGAQEEDIRRKFGAPETVDGVSCAATGRANAEFHPSDRLTSCPLARDTTIGPHRFFAGSWVTLDESGRLSRAWLSRDTRLAGHLCKGTGYKGYSVEFRADETLELCYLARDTVIGGVPCLHGSFWTELRGGGRSAARFHPDGSLLGCQLSRNFQQGGMMLGKWERITLPPGSEAQAPPVSAPARA